MDKQYKYPYKRLKQYNRDEHVIVWEAEHGPVPPGHVIHHVNEDKRDNRLENLELKTRSQHASDHYKDIPLNERFSEDTMAKLQTAWKKNGEKMRKSPIDGYGYCNICKQILPEDAFNKNASRYNGLMDTCRTCRSEYRKELVQRNKNANKELSACPSIKTIPTAKTGENLIAGPKPVTVPAGIMAATFGVLAIDCTNTENNQ